MDSSESDAEATVARGEESPPSQDLPPESPRADGSWSGAPAANAGDPLLGTTLHETYIVECVIGEGGMGRVYEARHTRIKNKRFALKVLHAEYALNSELQTRFQREAEAAAAIEHAGVVGTYDVGRTPQGWPYMVCEYLTGEDLNSYVAEHGPLPQETVVHIGLQLCTAIAAAHAQSVIHRDLKPHNVFVLGGRGAKRSATPQVKVLDFGLSRFIDNESQLTKTGVVLGTPGYMSPEQAQGHETGTHTDIYGIGAILYAASTGSAPFREKSPQLTVLAVMHKEAQRPRARRAEISEALELVIQRAMAREPAERYASPAKFSEALASLNSAARTSALPGAFTSSSAPSPQEAHAARLRLVLWLVAALVLLLVWSTSAFFGTLGLRNLDFQPSTTESWLLAALATSSLLPALLLWRRMRREVWTNTAKVVELLHQAQSPVIAGLFAYGTCTLLLRLASQVIVRRYPSLDNLLTWPEWSLILPLIGALAASCSAVHVNGRRNGQSRLRLWLTGPILTSVIVLVSGALLYLGAAFHLRAHPQLGVAPPPIAALSQVPDRPVTEKKSGTSVPSEPAQLPPIDAAAPDAGAPEQTSTDPAELAPADELSNAIAAGPESLEILARRYANDPDVLKSLVLAYASRSSTLSSSIDAMRRLLRAEPEFRKDAEIRIILAKATLSGEPTRKAASHVLRHHMGKAGGDLIYELLRKHPAHRANLTKEYRTLRRLGHVSKATQVAYDLRNAPSCKARLRHLKMAQQHGDARSIRILAGLSAKPSTCHKGQQCKARCNSEAEQFRAAIQVVRRRLAQDPAPQ